MTLFLWSLSHRGLGLPAGGRGHPEAKPSFTWPPCWVSHAHRLCAAIREVGGQVVAETPDVAPHQTRSSESPHRQDVRRLESVTPSACSCKRLFSKGQAATTENFTDVFWK